MSKTEKKEARFYQKLDDEKVRCLLCPNNCLLKEGQESFCQARKNIDGTLYAINYGQVATISVDPIEKKPLYHYYPGYEILSIAQSGCNLRCVFCQNWHLSQMKTPAQYVSPEEMVKIALRYDSFGISYTYSEPMIWFEYLMDTGRVAHQHGLKNVLVTNGYINEDPLKELLTITDAMNIDIKSMDEEFYRKLCKADASVPRRTVELSYGKAFIEVTNLIIPSENDNEDNIKALVDWLASVSPDIPLHFSRYHPSYKLDHPPTPESILFRAREIAMEKLNYVYIGNIYDPPSNHTYCPECKSVVIQRSGYNIRKINLTGNRCSNCNREILYFDENIPFKPLR